jgi:hypothetical protein
MKSTERDIRKSMVRYLKSISFTTYLDLAAIFIPSDAPFPLSLSADPEKDIWLILVNIGDGIDPDAIGFHVCDATHVIEECHNI